MEKLIFSMKQKYPKIYFFTCFLIFVSCSYNFLFASVTDILNVQNKIEIPYEKCLEIENKLGQILYINVDGFTYSGEYAINPEYVKLVQELNIGGVLARLTEFSTTVGEIVKSTRALQQATDLPLLIGIDYATFEYHKFLAYFIMGLGYDGGFIETFAGLGEEEFNKIAYVDAFLHRALGINHALGPTVERRLKGSLSADEETVNAFAMILLKHFKRFGIVTTAKHYPYTAFTYSMHENLYDEYIPLDIVEDKIHIFAKFKDQVDFIMTTHILNSAVDKDNIVTFSSQWLDLLRKKLGFEGLVLTDALFMLRKFSHNSEEEFKSAVLKEMIFAWAKANNFDFQDSDSIFAIRSILSGHDMVFLEGTAQDTRKVFNNIHMLACKNTSLSNELRAKILKASDRVVKYKMQNYELLKQNFNFPEDLIYKAASIAAQFRNMNFNNSFEKVNEAYDEFKCELEQYGIAFGYF